ncbi:MAG: YmfQ family protein [Acetatifactor muris]|nr:YmfQ family protein [Acetatifactor muris]
MLNKSVPPFVAQMREMAELFMAEQPEIDRMERELTELLQQFYIKTATYSLEQWEDEFGIERNSALTMMQRRARVLAKLNSNPPATVKMLENLVFQILSANAVTIVEYPAEYCFDIYVNSDYLVETFDIADEAVRLARPAHLSYKFINRLIRNSTSRIYYGIAGGYIGIVRGAVEE